MKKSELLPKRENSKPWLKKKSSNLMPIRSWKIKNGLKNKNNTMLPNTLSKELRPLSLKPLKTKVSSKRIRLPLSLRSLNTWWNTPKHTTSRGNLGTPSSSSFPKSPPQLPFRPTKALSKPLLIFAIRFWTKSLSPEKSKEKTMNIGFKSTPLPEPPCQTKLTNWPSRLLT